MQHPLKKVKGSQKECIQGAGANNRGFYCNFAGANPLFAAENGEGPILVGDIATRPNAHFLTRSLLLFQNIDRKRNQYRQPSKIRNGDDEATFIK